MHFIKRLLLILVLTTIFSLNSGNCCEISAIKHDFGTISATKTIEKDFLNSKDNEIHLSSINNNETTISSRRNMDNQTGASDDETITTPKQFNNLAIYIYNQAYLEDKNELALLLLLHQIQPNAP